MAKKLIDHLVVRNAHMGDLDKLLQLSEKTGSGMTSMPTDQQSWIYKLERSTHDFNTEKPAMDGDIYFMVLEDQTTQELVGSGAFYVGIGLQKPFYSYKMSTITKSSEKLGMTVHTRILNLVNDYTNTTEVGSLFLLPEYRRDGIGKFLSRSRFLLLANFPERFNNKIFAELRGWIDENDCSPFWEGLGKKFFDLSFKKADFISAVNGSQFISDLMPKYPVYVDLLPQSAQDVIGKPHKNGIGALSILEKEGFSTQGYVDIFDAGPTVECELSRITAVKDSQCFRVAKVVDNDAPAQDIVSQQAHYIVSNTVLKNYRMAAAPIAFTEHQEVTLLASTAQSLNVQPGDTIRAIQNDY